MPASVLVVDDEPAIRTLLCRVLDHAGYQVQEAANGRAALAAIAHRRPDLVLTDWMMPHMGGEELVARLAQDPTPIPCIVVSAYPEAPRRTGLPVLQKPFTVPALLEIVAATLATEEARRAAPRQSAVTELASSPRILVLEDDPGTMQLLERLLAQTGYDVSTSMTLLDLDQMQQLAPDLIVQDLLFGRSHEGSWDLLHQLRRHPALGRVPIVLCTAAGLLLQEPPLASDVERLQLTVVHKPFSLPDLLTVVGLSLSDHPPAPLS